MIDLSFLESLIQALDRSSLDSIEIERGGTRIRLAKAPSAAMNGEASAQVAYAPMAQAAPQVAAPAPAVGGESPAETAPEEAAPSQGNLIDVTCPMVGTFYRSPAPDAAPYVEVGSRVAKDDTLCIIEAMKLMNELDSEVAGTIAEVCVQNADPVEYGQVLFRLTPS
ncbi:MAG: acetyl-CoA carboxylase biotin carboxyl carrier protein [Gemmatimonadota bacterium]|nr:MAG: acetyl-CoA carboxylase biotin carboxyl carrier protein [Gemmatimonadota bacterium]